MKKHVLFLMSILMFGFCFLLSSCHYEEEVGVWIVETEKPIENNKQFTDISSLEEYRISLGIEYYVDGYTTEKAISHLNSDVEFFHSIKFTDDIRIYYRIVDVVLENGVNTLLVGESLMPTTSNLNASNTLTFTRTVKGSKVYIFMQYIRDKKES